MNKNSKEIQKKLLTPYKDLILISVVAVVLFIAGSIFNFADSIAHLVVRIHDLFYPFDEILTVSIFLVFAFILFSLRRWKELRDELVKSKSKEAEIRLLAQTVVSVKDCISITDLNDNIIFVNDSLLKTYGYTEDELLGKKASIFHSRDIPPDIERQILPSTLAGEWHGELINRRKDGSNFPIELWTSLVKGEDGEPVGMVGVARDITKRKHAEEVLHRKEEHQSLVLQSLPMVFYMAQATAEMTTTWISEQVENITGFTPKQFTESSTFWQNRLHPDDLERVLREHDTVFKNNYVHTQYRWHCANGLYRWFSDHMVLTRENGGKPKEIVGIWRDITERKRLEFEKEKLISELKEAIANIKTLSGFIPICASCKKIRDDRGYWNQVEEYVMKHSDARFSHGFCPECTEKYFPGISKE
ncbi:MAG: PAS domain S-box protein [Ignavibacteriales bacterium]|nr:PAS domain S-box protein [Ignavibacteriales bacterium]